MLAKGAQRRATTAEGSAQETARARKPTVLDAIPANA
jgi:hypothetical protein